MTLVSTDWLANNLKKVKILDASWHMPSAGRNAQNEFNEAHIDGAQFFDLDKSSDEKSPLPHMLPDKDKWANIVSNFGISNNDRIVIYDNSDVLSSCRCWYMFIYFGHDINKVLILDGGLKKWQLEKKKLTTKKYEINKTNYQVNELNFLVKNINQIEKNITTKEFNLIDARGANRFKGQEPEPRTGLRSGNIKNSKNIPFGECINKSNNTFKNINELKKIFDSLNNNKKKETVFTCGSGVTACVLAVANFIINGTKPVIYDGSWAEYGIVNKK